MPPSPSSTPRKPSRLFQKGIDELGENPTIELLAYDDSTSRDIATFLQSQLQDNLGAKIDIKVQPFDRKLELEENGDFQLSWQAWIADYNDPMTFLDLFESTSAFNTYQYSNPDYDKLISSCQGGTRPDQAHGHAGGGREDPGHGGRGLRAHLLPGPGQAAKTLHHQVRQPALRRRQGHKPVADQGVTEAGRMRKPLARGALGAPALAVCGEAR